MKSSKRILQDIYERREKKIISVAMNKSRTGSEMIDQSNLLEEEKALYHDLVNILNQHRYLVLNRVMEGRIPLMARAEQTEEKNFQDAASLLTTTLVKENLTCAPLKRVKFLSQLPKFYGEELEEYGPYDEEDVSELPTQLAELLIKDGKAEEVQNP
jgi:DNA replication initiation complex subunit (GINS family)